MRQYLVLVALLMFGGCRATPEQRLQDEAHDGVRSLLQDPESAHFLDDPMKIFPDQGLVCGEVSSKNGDQQYVYVHGEGATLEDDTPNFLAANEKCIQAMLLKTKQIEQQSLQTRQDVDETGARQVSERKSRKRRRPAHHVEGS